jgi:hypothetical protein
MKGKTILWLLSAAVVGLMIGGVHQGWKIPEQPGLITVSRPEPRPNPVIVLEQPVLGRLVDHWGDPKHLIVLYKDQIDAIDLTTRNYILLEQGIKVRVLKRDLTLDLSLVELPESRTSDLWRRAWVDSKDISPNR